MRKPLIVALALGLICLWPAAPLPGQTKPASASDVPGLEELLAKVAAYDYAQSRAPLAELDDLVRGSLLDAARVRRIEARMDRVLESGATLAGKQVICRHLRVIGTEASVPMLAKLLGAPETADMARYALAGMRVAAVDQALRKALAQSSGNVKVGLINTLGVRGDALAVPALGKLVWDSDPANASAAVAALGRIGNAAADKALAQARKKAQGELRMQALQSSLACADRLAERGGRPAALTVYKELSAVSLPPMIRIGALSGWARAAGSQSIPALLEASRGGDPKIQAAALSLMAAMPGPEAAKALLGELPKLPVRPRVQILYALADRGDPAAREVIAGAVSAPEEDVRVAALFGLGKLGAASDVRLLVERAVGAEGAEQAAARESLYLLRGSSVDEAIVSGISSGPTKQKVELMRACGERVIASCAGVLLAAVQGTDAELRREAIKALRDTAGKQHIAALADLVVSLQGADRREAGRTLAATIRRSGNVGGSEVTTRYTPAASPEVRIALLEVMGQVGTEDVLPTLRSALKDSDSSVRRAAITAATVWPSPAPLADLMRMTTSDTSPALRILSLRGVLKLLALPNKRPATETISLLGQSMRLATQANEKRGVLALLPQYPSRETLDMASAATKDAEVGKEAKMAVEQIQKSLDAAK